MDGARTKDIDYQKLTIERFLDGVKALSSRVNPDLPQMKQILSCQQSKYVRDISLKAVEANVPCYYQLEIQRENSIDWREGISQIVKCVGVETPHCRNVEMWWIHIVKMWRCGGSTLLVWRSTLISNLSKNKRKSPLC